MQKDLLCVFYTESLWNLQDFGLLAVLKKKIMEQK